jgi:hypothetical protein
MDLNNISIDFQLIFFLNDKYNIYKYKNRKSTRESSKKSTRYQRIRRQENKKLEKQLKLQENTEAHHQKTKNPRIHHHAKKNFIKKRGKDQLQVGQRNKRASKLYWFQHKVWWIPHS